MVLRTTVCLLLLVFMCEAAFAQAPENDLPPPPPARSIENPAPDPDRVFEKVELDARFGTGEQDWKKFLERNLQPENVRREIKLKKRQIWKQTANVAFVVEKDGAVSGIKVENEVHPAVKKEVLRVFGLSPKWTPAIQGGSSVRSFRRQSIHFSFDE